MSQSILYFNASLRVKRQAFFNQVYCQDVRVWKQFREFSFLAEWQRADVLSGTRRVDSVEVVKGGGS